jgi:hypothetical protein
MTRPFLFTLAVISAAAMAAAPAAGQIVLPGAVLSGAGPAGKPGSGGSRSLSPGKTQHKRNSGASGGGAVGKPPGEEAVADRPLHLNGLSGALEFTRRDKALLVKRVIFAGEQAAKPGEACEVNVAMPAPVLAKPAGQPAGLLRYDVELDACPFSFDVLDDAVILSSPNLTCNFQQAGCQVNPTGLWGPQTAQFTPARAKEIEHARTRWEAAVRAGFRDAVARARDKGEVTRAAKEQAGFSSERETQCRDYAKEDVYGFCAARITEARAFALRARTAQLEAEHAVEEKDKKNK